MQKPRVSWELLVASRLYVITFLFLIPVVHVFIQIGYFQPWGLVFFGFTILLLLKFVFFEPRTAPNWYLKFGLAFLLPITCIIMFNFVLGIIINLIHGNMVGFLSHLGIIIGSFIFFGITIRFKPLRKLNLWLVSRKQTWSGKDRHFLKRHPLTLGVLGWLIISPILILVPYSVYRQDAPAVTGGRRIGVWISSYFFDVNGSNPLNDTTLQLLANNNIYAVISIKQSSGTNVEFVERLNRCKNFGIEVHLSIGVTNSSYKYVNIWNIEKLMVQIEAILIYLDNYSLLGDPVTTVVYDMEIPSDDFFYPVILNSTIREKFDEYYTIQEAFNDFNQHIKENYNISTRICTDYFQGFDRKDWDDDLRVLHGLMDDPGATMSYMVYRRDNLGQNHILDHCRYLDAGETIILNAWKFEGYHCWNDVECGIEDARLVLGYPGKTLHLEIWTLYYFLKSYGIDGFHTFINALVGDWTTWPVIKVENVFPYSSFWDLVLIGVSLLDFYGPLFRILNGAV